jgi:hypothetical protein
MNSFVPLGNPQRVRDAFVSPHFTEQKTEALPKVTHRAVEWLSCGDAYKSIEFKSCFVFVGVGEIVWCLFWWTEVWTQGFALTKLWGPGSPQTPSYCFSFLNSGITDIIHHAPLKSIGFIASRQQMRVKTWPAPSLWDGEYLQQHHFFYVDICRTKVAWELSLLKLPKLTATGL